MNERQTVTIDGNEAAASVAFRLNEVIAIYPITPSSAMGEWADQWASEGKKNIWGTVPLVVEMQSEGGAAGAVHGALQTGSLSTTFTASQGLLLMIPNMYKIAGELLPAVFHVAARSVATHALSIFGDHSDVMAARSTGWAMLASNSVQEAMDLAAIAHAATLQARVPFVHFFDGFRTSHEVMKVEMLSDDDLRALVAEALVQAHRARGLSPEHPVLRGSAQNPDVFFQAREAANPYYLDCPAIVQNAMDRFFGLTGRQYRLFEYSGAPDAERVMVLMGSAAETAQEAMDYLTQPARAHSRPEKIGLLKVRLYRPFAAEQFVAALPPTVKALVVLDRTKEPGSAGEPLYQDVVTAISECWEEVHGRKTAVAQGQEASSQSPSAPTPRPRIIGGRYGLSSKEFTPAMVKAAFDELQKDRPKNHFTLGIVDDITHTSLDYDRAFSTEADTTVRCVLYGLGSDGTVGANKNSIKIIGEDTPNYAQGYFVYDSKKSGSVTVSHLRFGPQPIHSAYLIHSANFVACHQFSFLEQFDMLQHAQPGGVFLLNSPFGPEDVWDQLPVPVQQQLVDRRLRFYVIDGNKVARETGMGGRVNTIMQTCFFAISGILPPAEAIAAIKKSIQKAYGKRGEAVVRRNFEAVDQTLAELHQVPVPAESRLPGRRQMRQPVPPGAPPFVQQVTARLIAGQGDELPVSALPAGGTFPTATSQWEKRNIALEMPVWDPDICIQCGKCVFVCPHAVIREKVYEPAALAGAPPTFKSAPARWKEFDGWQYTLQVSPEDCTGCALCIEACPVKNKTETRLKAINMASQPPLRTAESANWNFFLRHLPEVDRRRLNLSQVKDTQLLQPLFEFSGACAGCGETPYLKLLSQLFGDRALIANATGCSSIYGGNLPTTPWAQNQAGRGPAWANSLFEDNAEFGLGFRLTLEKQAEQARELLAQLAEGIGPELVAALLAADQTTEAGLAQQRERVADLKQRLTAQLAVAGNDPAPIANLLSLADVLVRRSVWLVGGDGWAYDIGYGGLDHVLASGRDVNVLVLDTEVYSNTGGQMSKSTPRGAVAKFAAGGKGLPKKDLGLLAMSYGNVYVARIALGANDGQTVRAFLEAEAYPGPSLIIAYSHCIAHGYDMRYGLDQQKRAVQSGHWPLYRFNPSLSQQGQNPFMLDSKPPSLPLEQYMYNETRFRMLTQTDEARAETLLHQAQADVQTRWKRLEQLAKGNV